MNDRQRKAIARLQIPVTNSSSIKLDPKRLEFYRSVGRGGCVVAADDFSYSVEIVRATRDGRRYTARRVTYEAMEDGYGDVIAREVCASLRENRDSPRGFRTHRLGRTLLDVLFAISLPHDVTFGDGPRARAFEMLRARGYVDKAIESAAYRLADKGLIDYGVSPIHGWATPAGRAALEDAGIPVFP